jgi:hypothetical protein
MTQANEKSATIDRLKSELNDSQQTIDYFHDLLQDNKDINIFACGACLADASEVSISNNSLSSIDFFSPLFLLTRVFKRCKRETKTLVEMVVFEIWQNQLHILSW